MKIWVALVLILSIGCCLTGCKPSKQEASGIQELPIQAVSSYIIIHPSQKGVDAFLKALGNDTPAYENDTCYNITPSLISDKSNYQVFKFDQSCNSYLFYNNSVYQLGTAFGGYGVTSVALADMNKDTLYELYFTCSFGSGIHRSQIGYFDPAKKQVVMFDPSYMDIDCILHLDNNDLCVSESDIILKSFVDFKSTAKNELGTISYINGLIQYNDYTQID